MRSSYLFALLMAAALPMSAIASDATPVQPSAQASACVDVEINGYRALSYDCLSQQLAPSESGQPGNPALASEAIAGRASNQLGLFNRSATSNRMGNNFGKSAFPQRPPPVQNVAPLSAGRGSGR